MKFKDKKMKVLKSLYEKRNDSNYHNIAELLNLEETNQTEISNIGKSLETDGLIGLVITLDGVHGVINAAGIEYIEELDEIIYAPEDTFNPEEKSIIIEKINEFGIQLTKIEAGQQITYDDLMAELEELKALMSVLGKKNWIEVLKGKLVDAGYGTIGGEVINLIIETFKNEKLLE